MLRKGKSKGESNASGGETVEGEDRKSEGQTDAQKADEHDEESDESSSKSSSDSDSDSESNTNEEHGLMKDTLTSEEESECESIVDLGTP